MMIISNQAKCKLCLDAPFSAYRHDYKECRCGAMAVDGGQDYLKRTGDLYNVEEMSICVDNTVANLINKAGDWARENERNGNGAILCFLRYLRDSGYDLSILHEEANGRTKT